MGGGLPDLLQYYMGVGRQMITVLHRGGLANDYSIPRTLGYSIRNIISIDSDSEIRFFSFGKKSFLGGYINMVISLHRGVRPNDYSIT